MQGTKTVAFNIVAPIFLWLADDYGIIISPEYQEVINLAVLATGNLILRVFFTKTPVFRAAEKGDNTYAVQLKPKKKRRKK